MRLTSIDLAPYVNANSLIHIVNTGDTSQSPEGSSYKAPLSYLVPLIGNEYWSASTGTNSLVKTNSSLSAGGDYSLAEGVGNSASGYASHAGGYNSTAFGLTSFVHSSNSVAVGARSAVLGGQGITGTTADTVYVPNLNINTTPATDNALTSILVRANDGTVKTRTIPTTIGGSPLTWETIVRNGGSTYSGEANHGYVSDNQHPANPTIFRLPTTASTGDVVKVMVLDGKSGLDVDASQSFVYGTGNNDTGGSFTQPYAFYFGKYETAEATYIGSNKWVLSSFQTTQDLSANPLTDRIL